jgi:hypothetical protein
MNQGPGKCSRCLLRCWCVHSIPFLQVTELLIDLGQATNMNWYRRKHVGWHAVTNCIWSSDRPHDIMRTLSYNHTHTIIHIQSYTYKRTHFIIQWCCTQVCDAFPWEVVYETFLWKAVLIPGLCACIGAVQRIDCRIPGLCAFHPCSLPEWWLDPWS